MPDLRSPWGKLFDTPAPVTIASAMWLPDEAQGADFVTVEQHHDGLIVAQGVVLAVAGGRPFRINYVVQCDRSWQLQSFDLMLWHGREPVQHRNGIRTADGQWAGGRDSIGAFPEFDGCTEIDIEATPFTNTLPIRRLGLTVGESAEIQVLYISVPDLSIKPVRQRYTRLADGRTYRYESLASGFTAVITVDDDGLVTDYPGLFRRVSR